LLEPPPDEDGCHSPHPEDVCDEELHNDELPINDVPELSASLAEEEFVAGAAALLLLLFAIDASPPTALEDDELLVPPLVGGSKGFDDDEFICQESRLHKFLFKNQKKRKIIE